MVRIFLTQRANKRPFSFPPHPTFVSALSGENRTSKISLFYPMRYDCLINITRKNSNVLYNAVYSRQSFKCDALFNGNF